MSLRRIPFPVLVVLVALVAGGGAFGVTRLLSDSDDEAVDVAQLSGAPPNSNASPDARRPAARSLSVENPHPVAGNFEPNDERLADCSDNRCYEQAFGNITYDRGPKAAFRIFDRKLLTDRAIEANCHRIAHTMGSAALARYRGNVAKAFAQGSASCWSGYYHGILERAFRGTKRNEIGTVARRLCAHESVRRRTFIAYQCVHGLGHGLMLYTGYDMPRALVACDQLYTDWDRRSCSGGVFMENIVSSGGFKSPYLRDDDPVYPCRDVRLHHKYYCYVMVTSRILELNGYDWEDAADTCREVEPAWVATCFQSFGRDASGYTRQNAGEISRLCELAAFHERSCVYGGALDIASNYAGGEEAAELCRISEPGLREDCFRAVGIVLGGLEPTSSGRRSACAGITREHLSACLEGAGERIGTPEDEA